MSLLVLKQKENQCFQHEDRVASKKENGTDEIQELWACKDFENQNKEL